MTDGTSNTYLIGEKYMSPDYYATGMDPADNEDALMGDNADIARWVALTAPPYSNVIQYMPPRQDTPGLTGQDTGSSAAPTPSALTWPSATARRR